MAGLRDRPLTRDALLAGAIIAAGAVAALIGVDRGNAPTSHFGFGPSPLAVSADAASTAKSSAAASHLTRPSATRKLPRQIGSASSTKKKSDDTVVVMVPDLPPRENPEAPPAGGWTEQGSAAPVSGANSQAPTLIAMSATGGVSQPLTSPTGNSLPNSSQGTSGQGINSAPASNSPGGGGKSGGDGGRHVLGSGSGTHSGFVLLAGGQGGGKFALSSAEFFDPGKNTFAETSPMNVARTDHTATVLPGGQILIAGGEGASGRALSSAELYDPVSGKFSAIATTMSAARADHTATLISGCNCPADGKVLIAGGDTAASSLGSTLRSAELYDPATGTFAPTGSMKATRTRHSATLLVSGPLAGQVLIAGGFSDESGGDIATAELYDPVSGQFTPTGRMSAAREGHTATWLSPKIVSDALGGNVLVAGGGPVSSPNDSAEVFNPQTATFSPVGSMTTARTMQAAVLLATGKVLIAGGQGSDTDFLQSAELFDPAHATFAATGSMKNLHSGATPAVLENGNALIAGGRSGFADLYDPTSGTFSATGRMVTDLAESTSTLIR